MAKDYYKVLGVEKSASADEVKRAFRKKAHEYHPDKDGGNEEKFKEVNEAYQVLGDEQKRKQYDQFGSAAFENGGFGQGFGQGFGGFGANGVHVDFGDLGDLGDIFGSIFGGRQHRRPRGQDLETTVRISFKEMVYGVERELNIEGKTFNVAIPAGIQDGQALRLRGKGGAAPEGGDPGDLYVRVVVDAHKTLVRHGAHIHLLLKIGFTQAALGDELEVETVDGSVKLKIPAGTQSGAELRLRGKGVETGRGRGDQFVTVQVMTPKRLNRKQKKLLEDLDLREE